MMKSKFGIALAVVALTLALPIAYGFGGSKKPKPVDSSVLLKREETMVLNLGKGPKSARFYLLQSLSSVREMDKNLYRAMRQVEQVDANYAKARNRRDDLTMQSTVARIKKAQETLGQLEQELEQANNELKSDIQNTLIR